ncbi:MAG: helical backbone metal receptor [Crocinitomicaceae bacterium]|nr:helical backbone metal receptor [Crocinitomicaceae bacterium]
MKTFRDQLNNSIYLKQKPNRIISLVPSQTELLSELGLEKEVIGITKFCIHPNSWKSKKKVIGGTKKINLQKIIELNPNLIIANKEENSKEDIELLQKLYPVWISNILNVNDLILMINSFGEIFEIEQKSKTLISSINTELKNLKNHLIHKKVLYLIWNKPVIVVGTQTYIDSQLKAIGLNNVVQKARYPKLEEIEIENPDFIFLSSEPYPFQEKHRKEFEEKFPNSKTIIVDGEMFSWYGSRILKAIPYFRELKKTIVEQTAL